MMNLRHFAGRFGMLGAIVASAVAATPVSANLIVNPGFEADGPSASVRVPTGWTSDAAYDLHPSFNFVTNNSVFVYEGNRSLSISNFETDPIPHLSQTFADTNGVTYEVTFFATSLFGSAGSFLDVAVGGSNITLSGTLPAYAPYSFAFVGTGSDTLSIGALNSQGYYYVDGVSVDLAAPPTVPEPATLALLGLGLAGIGFMRRDRKSVV
jgi:hypothetical protein